MPKRNVEYYANSLALKYGTTKKDAMRVLLNGFQNLATNILKGNDVRIPKFGHIYFDKQQYAEFIVMCEQGRSNRRKAKRARLEKEQAERMNKFNDERERRAK